MIAFPTVTEEDFPDGLVCPGCGQEVTEGQPYASTPDGAFPDGSPVFLLTCVYCIGGDW